MPRQLPWKLNPTTSLKLAAAKERSPPPAATEGRSLLVEKNRTLSLVAKTEIASPAPRSKAKTRFGMGKRRNSSPLTSPPPAPLQEQPMIEGLSNDDQWRMVEDEFVAVAGDFTRHLHAAEYHRLKAAARLRNVQAIRTMSSSRPVISTLTKAISRMQELRQRQCGVKSEEAVEAQWAGTSLQGLMDSPKKESVSLLGLASLVGGSRDRGSVSPVKARKQQTHLRRDTGRISDTTKWPLNHLSAKNDGSVSDDDDDLDGGFELPERRRPALAGKEARRSGARRLRPSGSHPGISLTDHVATRATEPSWSASKSTHQEMPASADVAGDDADGDNFFARLRHRQAEVKLRREEEQARRKRRKVSGGNQANTSALDEVPRL